MIETDSITLWKNRIQSRKLSGLKVNDWCEQNRISRHAYYYWHRKIQVIKQKEKEDTFVEVAIPSFEAVPISKENKAIDLVITWKEFSITIRKQTDLPIAAELMQRLVKPC